MTDPRLQSPAERRRDGDIFDSLAALAAAQFRTSEETIAAVLALITDQLGLRTSFLTQIAHEVGHYEVIAAHNVPGGCDIAPGTTLELGATILTGIDGSVEPSPLLVRDISTDPVWADHAAAAAFPKIGSYLGVPIHLGDGSFFGTLCGVDPVPRPLSRRQAELLIVLARLLATQIERDRELAARQRVEEELRTREARYRAVAEQVTEGLLLFDGGTGRVLESNPAIRRLLGYDATELTNLTLYDLSTGPREVLDEQVQRATDQDHYLIGERHYRRKDGSLVEVEVSVSLVTRDKRIIACAVVRDLRGRKRAERALIEALAIQREANVQLEQLNRVKTDFVAIASHEFRTPLTNIQGFSELIRDDELTPEEASEYAAEINKEAQRLGRMITDMLDLDRMESGRVVLHLVSVDVNGLIREALRTRRATGGRHEVLVELDPALPLVQGDADRLTQVVTILLSNAFKYSPDGGRITVGTWAEGEMVRVRVADQGMGIPPEALETIFDRYTRVESAAARNILGTGLGLPIARQKVELHGGRIWAESVPGEGATFHVALPRSGTSATAGG